MFPAMTGIAPENVITPDTMLSYVSTVAWWLFAVYAAYAFVTTLWRYGFALAVVRLFSYRVLLPLLLVVGLGLLSSALVFVQPQYVAVVVSPISLGGVRAQPLRAGLHWILPLLEREVLYPIYWQTYTMSGRPTEGAELGDDSIRARTSDGQEVRLDSSVIFRIDTERVVSLHIDWQHRYIRDLVRPVVRGVVRTQVSQFTVREVNSRVRKDLEVTLDRLLREKFAEKGLILDQFLLRDITFTDEFAAAIERKQITFEGKEEAEHQAEQTRSRAKGRADALLIEAEAQEKALKLIAEALEKNPNLLTYQYIEKLSPNLRVMLVPSNTPLILPFPRLDEPDGAKPPTSTRTQGADLALPTQP